MKKKSVFRSLRSNLREGGFFKLRVLFGVVLCLSAATILPLALNKASAQLRAPSGHAGLQPDGVAAANKIAPWVMEHTANGQQAEFFVVLADQADLSGADTLQTKNEKARFVYETLLNKSQATQDRILQWLRDRAIEHRSYYIVNAVLVKGTRQVADELAARPDVARIEGNPLIHNDLPQPGAVETSSPHIPATIEPGINYTHAPQVWALGFTGQNIVIASADTGVRWTHNALKPHYRGWDGANANHNYNWHDSIHSGGGVCGPDSPFPCDDFFHGSHTTGTAIGDDGAGNQIGMAPGAKWIGCRNMDQGNGTPARYMECMEFFLAPYPINCTPAQGDPTKSPDITINSWGCPASEGCSFNTLQAAVEAQRAAGIQMVVAAGNSGPGCSTVSDPPSLYDASYTAGALTTGTDTIAGFSSRGPVTVDGSGRIKPDICAPGTGTRSASNSGDAAYTTASGTSMATPHIAGAMGLLWCALPSMRHQITASRDALNSHAVNIASTLCGTAGPPNNVYGWGRVDIAAAVGMPSPTASPSPTPTATGTASACGGPGTPTPTATPTATAAGCSWSAGPDMPVTLVRAVGVYFTDGNFYTMGGRTADTAGSDFQHVLRYSPATNTWTQMGVTLPDNQMNNMACGVLSLGGTPEIYCVGGSAAGQTTATARVFYYNPVSDSVVTLGSGDNWPGDAGGATLPGGFAVTNNKLYILGGFNINVASTNQIWQFDPTAAVGAKWLQRVNTPEGIMYAPTAAIGGIIYVGGASDYVGGLVVDTTNSFKFDPVANTIGSIAAIPRATGETRGLTFNGNMYVMGGGRAAPNPSNQVNVYNPGTNSWSTGTPFTTPRRNFPTDTNGTNKIWLAGGYASDGVTPLSSMEIFMCQGAVSPTPTATPTATATHTPTATPTATHTPTPTPTSSPPPSPTATPSCSPGYTTSTGTGTITPGGTDIGNHCDDCTTDITLPFGVSVYGNPPVTAVAVGSDGDIHFPGPYNKLFWWPGCVPVDPGTGQDPFLNTFFPNYADLVTDTTVGACPGCGIFTQTVGTAPNRQFLIRWKTNYFNSPPGPAQAEFEVVLTEGSNTLSVIYGVTGDNGLTAVSGIQKNLNTFTSFSCNTATLTPGLRVNYIPTSCGSPTPTPTPTPIRTTPTPRPRPTPPPRP